MPQPVQSPDTVKKDTVSSTTVDTFAETIALETSSAVSRLPVDSCAGDTIAPWVYPEPSGGLHRGPVSIRFEANKPCSISWRLEPDSLWHPWVERSLSIDRTVTVVFKAGDRCGRSMEERREFYEIERATAASPCPEEMDYVSIGSTNYCIDRYEWPNRKGMVPLSYVSFYQATDSCFVAGKRLCSSEEWSLACSGPYGWKYPYGQNYERHACVTHDTSARSSGSKPECRAYFGSFDMSGNLLEWTATPSKENRQFYQVMGGFWESGPQSGCFDIRYSYFPQNRHNPVGFRCCKSLSPSVDREDGAGQGRER